ncbi:MAG: glycosyltransferase [Candidatus Woesebacteria bacterium]|jgi:glycosyltransferase involved in cell wall biosynthesis
MTKILVTTSSFPVSDKDEVPAFVKDQIIELKKLYPELDFVVHTPHNYYSQTVSKLSSHNDYKEVRYHYFKPYKWELLVGRGIMPALRKNKLLYAQIPFFIFFEFLTLLNLTKKEKPDLIYAHWFMPQAITASLVSKITGVPFAFTTHASDVSVLRKVPFTRKLIRSACHQAGAYTAVSKRTANKLRDSFSAEDWQKNFKSKLYVVPMGVSAKKTVVSPDRLKAVIQKYNLPQDKKFVLFIGRLAEKKGVEYLLEAIPQINPKILKTLHFIIAGDGQLKDDLIAKANFLGIMSPSPSSSDAGLATVTFTGYVHGADKQALLSIADATCFPSIIDSKKDSEGFPVVVMESLAAGKIVMTTDVSGAEDVIKSGVDGFIFKQKSSKEIKNAIENFSSMISGDKQKMQQNAKKLAQQFDWATIADKHYQIFKKVL